MSRHTLVAVRLVAGAALAIAAPGSRPGTPAWHRELGGELQNRRCDVYIGVACGASITTNTCTGSLAIFCDTARSGFVCPITCPTVGVFNGSVVAGSTCDPYTGRACPFGTTPECEHAGIPCSCSTTQFNGAACGGTFNSCT